jgi:GNAT superfamily N-acetyltransferase
MALTDLATPIPTNPNVRIEETSMKDAIDESEMMGRAYGLPLEVMRLFNELLAATAERVKSRGYFGYVAGNERPVAWSFLVYLPDSPTVLLGGAATLEEHRGQGLYSALVARRLADARADGRTAAVIQGDRNTSAPICAKLGFREICALEMFASAHE